MVLQKEAELAVKLANLPDNVKLDNYPICKESIDRLRQNGISYFFPVQRDTFMPIYNKKDVIGRARTGCGKTLAFSLPVAERMRKQGIDKTRGRPPKVLIMTPTRELAGQIEKDFRSSSPFLSFITIYGGASYQPQEQALWRGVDVVIGTPGDEYSEIVPRYDTLTFPLLLCG